MGFLESFLLPTVRCETLPPSFSRYHAAFAESKNAVFCETHARAENATLEIQKIVISCGPALMRTHDFADITLEGLDAVCPMSCEIASANKETERL